MSVGTKILVSIAQTLLGIVVGAIGVPVLWFIGRVLGLIQATSMTFAGLRWLMYLGGPILGALVSGGAMAAILSALDEEGWLGIALGAIGGAVGGLAGSIMFFPIVVIL